MRAHVLVELGERPAHHSLTREKDILRPREFRFLLTRRFEAKACALVR